MAVAIAINLSGLFCAQSANFCKTGKAFSTTGISAAPIDSLVSSNEFLSILNLPAAVSAPAAAAPPNVPPRMAMISSSDAPSLIMALISGDKACRPFMLPP
jgi:hypothetical protein